MCCTIGKYLLFIANIVFLLAGVALLGIGIAYRLNFDDVTNLIPDEYNVDFAPTATIVVGAIIFIIAFFGCCGAIKENRFLLLTYAVILLLILIAQVTIGIVAFTRIQSDEDYSFKDAILNATEKVFANYSVSDNNKEEVHVIQYSFKCCGVNSPLYWNAQGVTPYPYSCCGKDATVVCNVPEYTDGCAETVYEFLKDSVKVIGGVVIGIIATEVLGILIACLFSNKIKRDKQHY